jgi:glycosyltransferase involved in cell wall biosynthesis
MKFSVLVSVYHRESPLYLELALNSIWEVQTLKPNEIVLVKDGPLTDSLEAVIDRFFNTCGDVLKIVPLSRNVGLSTALNIGLSHCSFDYVARMDTDDICMYNRFEKQINFFKIHSIAPFFKVMTLVIAKVIV